MNSLDETLASALRTATIQGDVETARGLLERGVNINITDDRGWTPLLLAAKYGRLPLVLLLCSRGASVNTRNMQGRTALYYAAERGHAEVVSTLLQNGAELADSQGTFVLLAAIRGRYPDVVKLLLTWGANPNAEPEFTSTPLASAVRVGDEQIVNLLLEYGADVNGTSHNGSTALMSAVLSGKVDMAALLIAKGANVNAVWHRKRRTTLTIAYTCREHALDQKNPAIVARAEKLIELLYSAGAKEQSP